MAASAFSAFPSAVLSRESPCLIYVGPIVPLFCPAADWLSMLGVTTSPKQRNFPQEHPMVGEVGSPLTRH